MSNALCDVCDRPLRWLVRPGEQAVCWECSSAPSPVVAGEQDGCAHEWVYDSEGDYGECKLCEASVNVIAGKQESDQ